MRMPLTVEMIRERVERVASNARDNEAAHSLEIELWADVLSAISLGESVDPKACATEALRTRAVIFARWCA